MYFGISNFAPYSSDNLITDSAFIGGTDADIEGNWTWIDHQAWGYQNFPEGEPNGDHEENCLEMVKKANENKPAGWWNDIHCSDGKRGYVCSYNNGRNYILINCVS